jgi:hypothetical protein
MIKAQIVRKQKNNNDNLFGAHYDHHQETSPKERPIKDPGLTKKRFKKE